MTSSWPRHLRFKPTNKIISISSADLSLINISTLLGAKMADRPYISHILVFFFFCLLSSLVSSSLQSRSKQEDIPTSFPQVRTATAALEHDPQGLRSDSKHLNLVKLREHDDLFCELVNTVSYCTTAFIFPAVCQIIK